MFTFKKVGEHIDADESNKKNELSDDNEMIDANETGDAAKEDKAKSGEGKAARKNMADDTRNCKGCSKSLSDEAALAEHHANFIPYHVKIACD